MTYTIKIKETKGKELVDKILLKTGSYVKTKTIVKRQYNIDIYLEVSQ